MAENTGGVKFDAVAFFRAARLYPARMFKEVRKEYIRIAINFRNRYSKARLRGRPGVEVGTGQLRRSLGHDVSGNTLRTLDLAVFIGGRGAPYAWTHEGAHDDAVTTIRKKDKKLSIPLFGAKTSAGISQVLSPRQMNLKYGGKSSKGNTILRDRNSGEAMWVLVDEVQIPARLAFRSSWSKREHMQTVSKRLENATRRATRAGWGS